MFKHITLLLWSGGLLSLLGDWMLITGLPLVGTRHAFGGGPGWKGSTH